MSKTLGIKFYFAIFAVVLSLSLLGGLNKMGAFLPLWEESDLSSVTHDSGYGYYGFIQEDEAAKLGLPVLLKEDGKAIFQVPLSVNEDRIASIKEKGGGNYLLLENNNLYFSSTDKISADAGGHDYSVMLPLRIRSRVLLPFILFTGVLAAVFFYFSLKPIDFSPEERLTFVKCRDSFYLWIGLFLVGLCLLPWDCRLYSLSSWSKNGRLLRPIFQKNSFCLIILLVASIFLFRKKIRSNVAWILIAVVALENCVLYFAPEWNYYGTRSDTSEYIEEHTASSIRTIAYPKFVEWTLGVDQADLSYWRSDRGMQELAQQQDEILPDFLGSSAGLIRVVRAQKVVCAFVFLLCTLSMMLMVSPWLVFCFAQLVFSGMFLGVYPSYIMSETLSQCMLFLSVTAFIWLIVTEKNLFYLVLCLFSGLAILVRPANIFLLVLVIVAFICTKHRRIGLNWLLILGGFLLFVFLVSSPSREIYKKYKKFLWMPDSGYVEMGRALKMANEKDVKAVCKGECQAFLSGALEKVSDLGPDPEQNDIIWKAAIPQAEAMGLDKIECSWLFAKIYPTIFLRHFGTLVMDYFRSLGACLERSRLQTKHIGYLALFGLVVVISFIRGTRVSFSGLFFCLLHSVHLFVSAVNQPERRYIYSTEILFLFGVLLIFVSLFRLGRHSENRD